MKKLFLFLLLLTLFSFPPSASAIVDPLSVPNNKFGIHIISPTPDESSPAASLVNTNGDWGYVTFLIERGDREINKWQEFFNDLRRKHLIPIVRLATELDGNAWKRPNEDDAKEWADFLDKLNWPVKNRYVVIYNEPNHATEWGGTVDAKLYAKILDQTITELKNKNRDFFVLNGGFDASAPNQPPYFQDQVLFMQEMEKALPGIFEKLDGWVSHSYPNPGFVGSTEAVGRGTLRTWFWELQQLRNIDVTKNLPVFITETGWKHAEGLNYDPRFPKAEAISEYFESAFSNAFASNRIVAVTPFLLDYQESPFDHFSFKKPNGVKDYYPAFERIQNMPKISGQPIQENQAQLLKGEVYSSIVSGQSYMISLTFKNTGQSIWDEKIRLQATEGTRDLGISPLNLPKDQKVEPGQEYTFNIGLKAPLSGSFKVTLNLFNGEKKFDSPDLQFTTDVKAPVVLRIKGELAWKKKFDGNYILVVNGATGETSRLITLGEKGFSQEMEAKDLLPDYTFEFSLEKPFYHPSKITQTLKTGINTLDFGSLKPDIFSAILHPQELWKLLPFSN